MSATIGVVFFFMVVLGFTVTGLVGFGANLLMLPVLSLFFDIRQLVVVFAAVSFCNATGRILENRKGILMRDFLPMVLIGLAGTVLGLWLFHLLSESYAKLFLGCFVIVMAIYNLRSGKKQIQNAVTGQESWLERWFYRGILFFGGVLHGAFVVGGPLYVIYCSHYYGHDRLRFRGMEFGIIFVNSILVLLRYLFAGAYTGQIILLSGLGISALVVSFTISSFLLKRINDKLLYQLVQVVLLISGGNLAIQAVMKLLG